MIWNRAIAGVFLVLGLISTSLSPAQTLHTSLPSDLEGEWRVVKVEGEQPLFLNAASASDLLGRTLKLQPSHVDLWDGFGGNIKTYRSYVSSLNVVLPKPETDDKEIVSLGEKSRTFYQLTLSQCMTGDKAADNCPDLYFTKDEQGVSLVSYPFGLVRLNRIEH